MRYRAVIHLGALQSRNLLPQYKTEINCRETKPKLIAEIQNRYIKLSIMAAIQSQNIKRCDTEP